MEEIIRTQNVWLRLRINKGTEKVPTTHRYAQVRCTGGLDRHKQASEQAVEIGFRASLLQEAPQKNKSR